MTSNLAVSSSVGDAGPVDSGAVVFPFPPAPGTFKTIRGDGSERLRHLAARYALDKKLSARESDVFTRFVLEGKSSKEIAADLGIAYPTVKLYWTRICKKIECDDAIGALLAFIREAASVFQCETCGVDR